jgi:hypothetical protein
MNHEQPKTIIKFSYEYSCDSSNGSNYPNTRVEHSIDGDIDLLEACEAFENFLLSIGFRLQEGETVGILKNCY